MAVKVLKYRPLVVIYYRSVDLLEAKGLFYKKVYGRSNVRISIS
jgi:hypothetical protein